MKKFGFTLAEVLVTMAVIGVVASLTVPGMMANGKYQELSTKIAKFMSTTEAAATAKAVFDDGIDQTNIERIILYKKISRHVFYLNDGTAIAIGSPSGSIPSTYGTKEELERKYGGLSLLLIFWPNVKGLTGVQDRYDFLMTKKGYIFPSSSDTCLTTLLSETYQGKMNRTLADGVCKKASGYSYNPF